MFSSVLFALFADDPWADPYNDTTTNMYLKNLNPKVIVDYFIFLGGPFADPNDDTTTNIYVGNINPKVQ